MGKRKETTTSLRREADCDEFEESRRLGKKRTFDCSTQDEQERGFPEAFDRLAQGDARRTYQWECCGKKRDDDLGVNYRRPLFLTRERGRRNTLSCGGGKSLLRGKIDEALEIGGVQPCIRWGNFFRKTLFLLSEKKRKEKQAIIHPRQRGKEVF